MIPHLHETVQIGRNFPEGPNPRECGKQKCSILKHKKHIWQVFWSRSNSVEFHMLVKLNIKTRWWVLNFPDAGSHLPPANSHRSWKSCATRPYPSPQTWIVMIIPSGPKTLTSPRNSFKLGSILPGPTSPDRSQDTPPPSGIAGVMNQGLTIGFPW